MANLKNELKFILSAESKGFKKGIDQANASIKKFKNQVDKLEKENKQLTSLHDKEKMKLIALNKEYANGRIKRKEFTKQSKILKSNLEQVSYALKKNKAALQGAQRATKKLASEKKRLARESSKAKKKMSGLMKSITGGRIAIYSFIAAIIGLFSKIKQAGQAFLELSNSWSAINSLFDDGKLSRETKKFIVLQSIAHGRDAQSSAKAYYDIVSVGFTDQAKANEVFRASLKLAVVGIAETSEAAKLLTQVMAAYGEETYTAAQVSDALFTIVQKGKTTIPELAQSFGQVLNIATSVGVSIEQLGAMVSTLTRTTGSTAEAMTLTKGIFNSFVKKEGAATKDLVKELGFEWSAATFKSIGLLKMMQRLNEVTGGSADEIGNLIPNLRGMSGILGLARENGKIYNDHLEAQNNKTGKVTSKVKEMNEAIAQQVKILEQKAASAWRDAGEEYMWFTKAVIWGSKALARSLQYTSLGIRKFFSTTDNAVNKWNPFKLLGEAIGSLLYNKVRPLISSLKEMMLIFSKLGKSIGGSGFGKAIEKLATSKWNPMKGIGESVGLWFSEASKWIKGGSKEKIKSYEKTKKIIQENVERERKLNKETEDSTKKQIKLSVESSKSIRKEIVKISEALAKSFEKIDEKLKETLKKIRQEFSGSAFSKIFSIAASTQASASDIRGLSYKVTDKKSLNLEGVQALAKAAQALEETNEIAKEKRQDISSVSSMFNSLLYEIKDFKKEVTAQDILGIAEAVKTAFSLDEKDKKSGNFYGAKDELISLLKESIKLSGNEAKEKAKEEKEKAFTKALSTYSSKVSEIIQKEKENSVEFAKAVKDSVEAANLIKQAAEKFDKGVKVHFELKGELGKILRGQLEKGLKNQTGTQPINNNGGR